MISKEVYKKLRSSLHIEILLKLRRTVLVTERQKLLKPNITCFHILVSSGCVQLNFLKAVETNTVESNIKVF